MKIENTSRLFVSYISSRNEPTYWTTIVEVRLKIGQVYSHYTVLLRTYAHIFIHAHTHAHKETRRNL